MSETDQKQLSAEKIRVLRVSHSSLTPMLRARERALARNYSDIDLQVITACQWREAEVDVAATPDDLFPVMAPRTFLSKHVQLFAWNPFTIINALRSHRPHLIDLNHEPFSVGCAEVLTLCNWFAPRAAIVLQAAQNIPRKYPPPFGWFEKRAFRRVDAAYACGEATREVMHGKGFDKPMAIIPFGVDTEFFSPRPRTRTGADAPLTIGYVGRMLPGKGLNLLADALAQLATANWKLLVVGDGSERPAFEQQLRERGLLDRVEFLGAISYDDVPTIFQKLDMLVMPTQTTSRIREQFGRVLVEAMSSGVPVIGSTSGAIPEVIEEAGLIFPEGDVQALAAAMDRLLSSEILRQELARAGRDRVDQHYSWDRVADKTYEFYRRILRNQRARVAQTSVCVPKYKERITD
ncbi:MAG: glycosyltransferase family 4 protein [Pyrinomonadaceae bacterium]